MAAHQRAVEMIYALNGDPEEIEISEIRQHFVEIKGSSIKCGG